MLKSFVFVIFSVQIILAQHHFAPIPVNPFNNNAGWQRNPYAFYFPQPIFPTNGPFNPNPHGMPLPPYFPPPISPIRIPNFPLPINPMQNLYIPYGGSGPYFPAPPPNVHKLAPPQANPQQPWNGQGTANQPNRNFLNPNNNEPMWPATTPTSAVQNEYNPRTDFNGDKDLPINSNANGGTNINAIIPSGSGACCSFRIYMVRNSLSFPHNRLWIRSDEYWE